MGFWVQIAAVFRVLVSVAVPHFLFLSAEPTLADSFTSVPLNSCEAMAVSDPFVTLITRLWDEGKINGTQEIERLLAGLSADEPVALFIEGLTTERLLMNQIVHRHWPTPERREAVAHQLRQRLSGALEALAIRAEVALETADAIQVTPLRFVLIEGGTFTIPEVFFSRKKTNSEVEVVIPYDFEVMDVPVTHDMWVARMRGMVDLGPDIKLDEHLMDEVIVDQKSVAMAAGVPITNLTVFSMFEFANRLSQSKGLTPAYSLSHLRGSAAGGDLVAAEFSLSSGRFRDVEGFRFPTTAEWAVMALNTHRHLNTLDHVRQRELLLEMGWFNTNSGRQLTRVGGRTPLNFPGGNVYDLFGLVKEKVHRVVQTEGGFDVFRRYEDGKDVSMSSRGGAITESAVKLDPRNNEVVDRADINDAAAPTHSPRWNLGFRLVRTLDPAEGRARRLR